MRTNKKKGKENMLSLFLCLFVCVDTHLEMSKLVIIFLKKHEKCYKNIVYMVCHVMASKTVFL